MSQMPTFVHILCSSYRPATTDCRCWLIEPQTPLNNADQIEDILYRLVKTFN